MASWKKLSAAATSKIYLVTWNVHGSNPPSDFSDLLQLSATPLPEMYVIGLQELGSNDWKSALLDVLKNYNYINIKNRHLLGIHIMLFVKRTHLQYVSSVESEVTKTGFKGVWGNKGAASIRLDFMGMNVIFVNSHLAAHMENVRDRIMNVDAILDGQMFRDDDTDNIMDHDYVFWMGDLNFRLEDISFGRAIDLIRSKHYDTLLRNDQLRLVMEEGLIFDGFQEGKIHFPPTYKFDVRTDTYDSSSQQRIPSYTDRILYHFHNVEYGDMKLSAKSINYQCHPLYRISDHKPVSAVIEINVMSKGFTNSVTFAITQVNWSKYSVNEVAYYVKKGFPVSTWDWIGLFQADFVELTEYVTYVWASSESTLPTADTFKRTVQFTNVHLADLPDGNYMLCYLTRKGSLCGASKKFTIKN